MSINKQLDVSTLSEELRQHWSWPSIYGNKKLGLALSHLLAQSFYNISWDWDGLTAPERACFANDPGLFDQLRRAVSAELESVGLTLTTAIETEDTNGTGNFEPDTGGAQDDDMLLEGLEAQMPSNSADVSLIDQALEMQIASIVDRVFTVDKK